MVKKFKTITPAIYNNLVGNPHTPELPLTPKDRLESEGSVCQIAESKDILIEKLLAASRVLDVREFTGFYDPCIEEDGEEGEPKYKTINRFLATYLNDMRYYLIEIYRSANLYFIGNTPQGDILGISTEAYFD